MSPDGDHQPPRSIAPREEPVGSRRSSGSGGTRRLPSAAARVAVILLLVGAVLTPAPACGEREGLTAPGRTPRRGARWRSARVLRPRWRPSPRRHGGQMGRASKGHRIPWAGRKFHRSRGENYSGPGGRERAPPSTLTGLLTTMVSERIALLGEAAGAAASAGPAWQDHGS
jgi:hypothetical protein